jgi:hypothetical protein
MFTFRRVLICTLALVLGACGGGETDSGSDPSSASSGGSNPGGTNSNGSGPSGANSGGSSFYLPFVATSSSGGETGLFVIPSGDLSSTPIFVTRTSANSQTGLAMVAYSKKPLLNGSNVVTSLSPYAILYVATGSDGNAHLYALDLSDPSVAPTAAQVSSLSLSSTADMCGTAGSAQTNLYDPTTLFLVLHTNPGGTSKCGKGGDVYQVVHYTDSSTTAPMIVNITNTMLTALYEANGALGGMALLDSTTGNLDFYDSDAFTSPTVLTTGVTSWSDLIDDSTVNNTGSLGATTAFLAVTKTSGTTLWRVASSGAAAAVYTARGGLGLFGVADTNNIYFSDTVLQSGTQSIYEESMSGGTPLELYGTSNAGFPPPPQYSLIGSNGTVLVLTATTIGAGSLSTSVLTLPVGTGATPTTIAGPFSDLVTAWMCPSSFGDVGSDVLVLNMANGTAPGSTTATSYSSEVLSPSGVVKQATLLDSTFLIAGSPGACGVEFGSLLQVRGIADTNGGYGGGTVNAFNLGSLSATALSTTTGSGTYTVPSGDQILAAGFLSPVIGSAVVGSLSSMVSSGLAFDLSKGLVVAVSVPSSEVSGIL